MIKNIVRALKKRELSNCNIIYIPKLGNQEGIILGLSSVFKNVFFEKTSNNWNDQYQMPGNVFCVPPDKVNTYVDYILFDDVLEGFDRAHKVARLFHSPLVYLEYVKGADVVRDQALSNIELEGDNAQSVINRKALCLSISNPELLYMVSNEPKIISHDVIIDNYCSEELIQKIVKNLDENLKINVTDNPQLGYNKIYGKFFFNTWNSPTHKSINAMNAGSIVFYFPSDSNNHFFNHLENSIAIDDENQIQYYIDMLLSNPDLHKKIQTASQKKSYMFSNETFSSGWKNKLANISPFHKG